MKELFETRSSIANLSSLLNASELRSEHGGLDHVILVLRMRDGIHMNNLEQKLSAGNYSARFRDNAQLTRVSIEIVRTREGLSKVIRHHDVAEHHV